MAKVAANSLPWLSDPSAGYHLFQQPSSSQTSPELTTPSRRLAIRGTELFLASGTQIRCADIRDLKARYPKFKVVAEEVARQEHKILDIPDIDFEIRQLELSHDELFLAVVGEKEVGICVLPGEGAVRRGGTSKDALKVKVPSWSRIGRKAFNESSEANIVKVLWHPLTVEGGSLLVLSDDGYLRVYDIILGSDISFEVPDQTFDLYALSNQKRSTGSFSFDAVSLEMTPASMCFASGETSWRPFTVYVLMRGGDIYGLTPVVPSRWLASTEYLNQLLLDITAEVEALDETASTELRSTLRTQTKWINDILNQQKAISNANSTLGTPRVVPTYLTRPQTVGPNPVCQGPFLFQPPPVEVPNADDYVACDIFHIDTESAGVIGIVHSNGRLDISLELDPLQARWVDKKKHKAAAPSHATANLPVVAHYETLNIGLSPGTATEENSWPTFMKDVRSPELLFVVHRVGVTAISMEPWISNLGQILEGDPEDIAIDNETLTHTFEERLEKSPRTVIQQIVTAAPSHINAAAVILDPYTGYIIIAGHRLGVESVEFEESVSPPAAAAAATNDTFSLQTEPAPHPFSRTVSQSATPVFGTPIKKEPSLTPDPSSFPPAPTPPALPPTSPTSVLSPPYTPHPSFTTPSRLPSLLAQIPNPHKPLLISVQTSTHLRLARDTLKSEYLQLMTGVQSLHDRAAAQRIEYAKQLRTIARIRESLAKLSNADLVGRVERFLERQEEMGRRVEEVLRVLVTKSERGLSEVERKWGREVKRVEEMVEGMRKREEAVRGVLKVLMEAVGEREVEDRGEQEEDGVPEGVRRRGVAQVRGMLRQEDELVKDTRRRLEGLAIEVERVC